MQASEGDFPAALYQRHYRLLSTLVFLRRHSVDVSEITRLDQRCVVNQVESASVNCLFITTFNYRWQSWSFLQSILNLISDNLRLVRSAIARGTLHGVGPIQKTCCGKGSHEMSLLRNCQVRPLETIRGRSIEIREHLHSRAYNGPNTRYTLTKLAADLYANILEWGLPEPTWRYTRYDRYQLQERLPYHCS